MAEWWEAVAANAGLTPAAFFTAMAVAAALYVAASALLARPAQVSTRRREAAEQEETATEPLPPPVQLGEVTEEELRAYDGSDPKKPLLMAIKGEIYDVTQSRMFYGPGGPYALFAGKDASRALAKMSFDPDDLTGDVSGLGPFEVEALEEWEYKFKSKYCTVGRIKKSTPVAEEDVARTAVVAERDVHGSKSNLVPEPKEIGVTNLENAVEKARETPGIDVKTSDHKDTAEKAKELPDSDGANRSSHADGVEKPEETPNADVKNKSSSEDGFGPKQTPPIVDEKNTSEPKDAEDATEKPKEEPDAADMKDKTSHEDAGHQKETQNTHEEDVSIHQEGEEKPQETLDIEVKNT